MIRPLAIALTFFAGTSTADEIRGRVIAVDTAGIVHLDHQQKVMLWGLDPNSVANLAEFLTGRWIVCNELAQDDGISLGDCGVSTIFAPPLYAARYLNLATWLPEFDMAKPACSVAEFGERFDFSRPALHGLRPVLPDLEYGCFNGVPDVGMLMTEYFSGPD